MRRATLACRARTTASFRGDPDRPAIACQPGGQGNSSLTGPDDDHVEVHGGLLVVPPALRSSLAVRAPPIVGTRGSPRSCARRGGEGTAGAAIMGVRGEGAPAGAPASGCAPWHEAALVDHVAASDFTAQDAP
jgi:hypothetical protein